MSLLLVAIASACPTGGGDGGPSPSDDAGAQPGPHDAGDEVDAGAADGGHDDGGHVDAGPVDGGQVDAGPVDPSDAGTDGGAGDDGGTPPHDAGVTPEADRFSIGPPGAAVDHFEASELTAPGGLDPAVDSFFDAQGRVAFGNVITFAAGSEEGAAHTAKVRLTFANQTPGGAFVSTGTAGARVEDESGVWVSERGGLTTGLINVTRLDTRVVGLFNLTLCRESDVLAGHCDNGTKSYVGSFDITRSPSFEPLPELDVWIDSIVHDPLTGDVELSYRVTNDGTAAVPTGTSLDVALWIDRDPPPDGDPTLYDSAVLDAPLLPGLSHSETATLDGVEGGGYVYLEVNYEEEIPEIDLTNNYAWRRYGGNGADLEVTLDSFTHERGVAVFDFTITNPTGAAYIADAASPLDYAKVFLFPDLAAPPTDADTPAAMIGLRPLLPPFGSYSSRAAVFLGATPTSGNAYLTVEYENEAASVDPPAGPVAWTGSYFPYDTVALGTAEAPIALGSLPARTVGQLQDEAWYSFVVPAGVDEVFVRVTATNDPSGTDNFVPGSRLWLGPDYDISEGCTQAFGYEQQYCQHFLSTEESPVKLQLQLPNVFSGPDQGSSFYLEVLPVFLSSLRVDVTSAEEDEELLTIGYTVTNDDGAYHVPADIPIPVYFWTHLADPTPLRSGDFDAIRPQFVTAEGVEFVTGGLLAGESRSGTYVFDLDGNRDYAAHGSGVAYAYVAPFHDVAPQCTNRCGDLRTGVGDISYDDNLSEGMPWGAPLVDLTLEAGGAQVFQVPSGLTALSFDLAIRDRLPDETTRVCYEVAYSLDYTFGAPYPPRLRVVCGDVEHGASNYDVVRAKLLFYPTYESVGMEGTARFHLDPRNLRREDDETNNESWFVPWKTN